ncbi:hypothetical protein ATL10_102832 [Bacillus sp. 196mf]|nr:hypothetical protein bcere0005_31590 [Bacillus cereus 172560W]PYE90326.1 hypothetical protein ATL10_102832 [Bacillus sp. 196mf]
MLKTWIDVAGILLLSIFFDIKCTESQALILHEMNICVNVTLFFLNTGQKVKIVK